MNETQTVIDLVSDLEIGSPAHAGGLTLIPLLVPERMASVALPSYLLYQQAHDAGLVSVEEVDEAGTVGELQVTNRANQPVLLVEGEVLLGMKQTRVLNITILVPAQTVLRVPVSCVESGRWRAVSTEATGKAPVHLAPSVRGAKTVTVARSMRSARTFVSDQPAVWAGVDRVLDGNGADAPSRSYADLVAQDPTAFTDVAKAIKPAPGQVGLLALVGGQVSCVDVFDSPQVLTALWSGLVASYQAEAFAARDSQARRSAKGAAGAARSWFRSIASGSLTVGPEIGLGAHVTVVAPDVEAAALVAGGRVVHLSAFPAHAKAAPTRFVRPARRRD
ncbi:MAG TPA: DUF6569 family protein [Candidatus Dormibacteraeota bacterium]